MPFEGGGVPGQLSPPYGCCTLQWLCQRFGTTSINLCKQGIFWAENGNICCCPRKSLFWSMLRGGGGSMAFYECVPSSILPLPMSHCDMLTSWLMNNGGTYQMLHISYSCLHWARPRQQKVKWYLEEVAVLKHITNCVIYCILKCVRCRRQAVRQQTKFIRMFHFNANIFTDYMHT